MVHAAARARPGAPETAGGHLVRRVPTAAADEPAGVALARLQGREWDALDTLWIVDAAGRLEGRVPLVRLVAQPGGRPLRQVMERDLPHVQPETDQEAVAVGALRHRLDSVPVVDPSGVLLGVVPPAALLAVLRREHVEDLHRLAGIARETEQARHALQDPPVRRARHRLPWLLIGLGGAMGSALLTARFEGPLESRVALAFFMPAIVYLADAIGTQTEAVVVRFLAFSRDASPRMVLGEIRTGLLLAAVLAALALPLASLVVADLRLGAAVALALLVAGALATAVGVLFPLLLSRAGLDPAFGSGPVATIVQDVLSLLAYLSIVTWLAS